MLLHGAIEERDLSAIRWVLFGGEPFVPKHLAALTRALPRARFSNVYGPAEVNQCTYWHLPGPWREQDGQPPIGRACPNADLAVLDEDDQPVAQGEAGELVVRAPTMMRGYWERSDLNARVFLRRPGAGGVEDVWLRTGDLAVERADGLLRFLGRKDRQVKTRGYRVELDEIEEALAAHPAVEASAAFPVEREEGLTLIEAAVTLRQGGITGQALTAFLASRLPPYAVPARIEVVAEFPRTTSGKIDRRRLSAAAAAG
jgi:acyl-coenzyme A synthetase/AMP-(fatty) acid ligase